MEAALAPIFARSKSEECFKPEESPAETLATQARQFAGSR